MDELFSAIRVLDAATIYPFERGVVGGNLIDPGDLLRHPFLVTPISDDRYLLLEDTALFERMVRDEVDHLPALVYAPDELRITCPTLALAGFDECDLRSVAARHPEQIHLEIPDHGAAFTPVHIAFSNHATVTVYLRDSSRTGCSAALEYLFATISNRGRYYPLINSVDDGDPLVRFTAGDTLLTMQDLSLYDLTAAATSGQVYPSGIIRVQPPFRVYNIDVPISILAEDSPLEEKSTFLRELISLRLQSQRTVEYSGRVYILNR